MVIVGFLLVFLLQVLHAEADVVRGCNPKSPEKEPVSSCNYYCEQKSNGDWMMGYYVNGTKCTLDDDPEGGKCLDLGPDTEGCYPQNSPEVKTFFGEAVTTQSTNSEPIPTESGKTKTKSKESKSSKKKKSKKKSKKGKKSKKEKKEKDAKAKKTKKEKKTGKTTPKEPEW